MDPRAVGVALEEVDRDACREVERDRGDDEDADARQQVPMGRRHGELAGMHLAHHSGDSARRRHASTLTTKYRNGSDTAVNWWWTPLGMASTSPSESSFMAPPSTALARSSPGATSRASIILPPVITVAVPCTTCMTSVTCSWNSTSPGFSRRPASSL